MELYNYLGQAVKITLKSGVTRTGILDYSSKHDAFIILDSEGKIRMFFNERVTKKVEKLVRNKLPFSDKCIIL